MLVHAMKFAMVVTDPFEFPDHLRGASHSSPAFTYGDNTTRPTENEDATGFHSQRPY